MKNLLSVGGLAVAPSGTAPYHSGRMSATDPGPHMIRPDGLFSGKDLAKNGYCFVRCGSIAGLHSVQVKARFESALNTPSIWRIPSCRSIHPPRLEGTLNVSVAGTTTGGSVARAPSATYRSTISGLEACAMI